jgi:aminoglycoside phosphotransferase (APT) family kinase protein
MRLLGRHFPELATLPIKEVQSVGTVNALFQLGDTLYVRLPLAARWAKNILRELRWLPWLSPHLSMHVPEPVAAGKPTEFYPFPWAIYRWIDGEPYSNELVNEQQIAARALAKFVIELRAVRPLASAPRGGRRPLRKLNNETRTAIAAADDVIDADAAMEVWELSLEAPTWDQRPVWIHGDLLRPNLLGKDGELRAVIDFGGIGVGDPAADLLPAWSVFG